jgi:hypothetical protein
MGYCITNLLCWFMGKANWHNKSDQRLASWNRKDSLIIYFSSYNLSSTECSWCCSFLVAFTEDHDREVQLEDIPIIAVVVTSMCFELLLLLFLKGYTKFVNQVLRKAMLFYCFISWCLILSLPNYRLGLTTRSVHRRSIVSYLSLSFDLCSSSFIHGFLYFISQLTRFHLS